MDTELSGTRRWVVENAKSQIRHYQDLIEKTEEEIKKSEWSYGRNMITLGVQYPMSIAANRKSWEECKKRHGDEGEEPFYIKVDDSLSSINIEQAKQLRDYLNQKIEYLES